MLVDDEAAGDPSLYASNWPILGGTASGRLRGWGNDVRDPRRLVSELDPDEERLGPGALT